MRDVWGDRDRRWKMAGFPAGPRFAISGCVNFEILLGRGLAFCTHPSAAWRRLPPAGRALLVGAYAAGGYVAVLSVLLLR